MVEVIILSGLFLGICWVLGYMIATSERRFSDVDREQARHEREHEQYPWNKYKYW